jgi:nitroreductase
VALESKRLVYRVVVEAADAGAAHGDWMYRRLFWECGLIGQVLYLEAEAAGVRGTGIGCFYDDPVHEALGLQGHAWQSLYHFCVGNPIEDTRLETSPGYEWEPRT